MMPSSNQPGFISRMMTHLPFWAYFFAGIVAHVLLDTVLGDDIRYQRILVKSFLLALFLAWAQERYGGDPPRSSSS